MPDYTSPLSTSRAGSGSEAAGYIPNIPDPMAEVQKALGLYTANIPGLISGSQQINAANQQQLVKQISDLYPQFAGNVKTMGADIGNWAAGNISDSTKNALAQAMAERGGTLGMGPNAASTNAALMAVLGKTTEGLQAQSIAAQNALLSGLPKAPLIDPTKLGPSPNELLQTISQGDLTSALINASPDPEAAYQRALKNAKDALAAGKTAGTGPFGGGAPTGTGLSPDLLNMLIRRGLGVGGGGGGTTTGTSGDGVPPGQPSSHTEAPNYGTDLLSSLYKDFGDSFWNDYTGGTGGLDLSDFSDPFWSNYGTDTGTDQGTDPTAGWSDADYEWYMLTGEEP